MIIPERELLFSFTCVVNFVKMLFVSRQANLGGREGRQEEKKGERREEERETSGPSHSYKLIWLPAPSDPLFIWCFKNLLTYVTRLCEMVPRTCLGCELQEFFFSVDSLQLGLQRASFENC